MLRKTLIAVISLFILATGAFLIWALMPLGPEAEALQAIQSRDGVTVIAEQNWLLFTPESASPQVGFIFYPGGRVDYRSYAPVLREIAAQGYLVALVRMPLNLAVMAPGRAAEVITAHPEITRWAAGGHSLGGAMAANYAYTHPGALQGLALWAAYPAGSNDLSQADLLVLSLYGTQDGVLRWENLEASRSLLPDDTLWVAIEGGNHAGFGSYGAQPGDGAPGISPQQQRNQIVQVMTEFLARLQEGR